MKKENPKSLLGRFAILLLIISAMFIIVHRIDSNTFADTATEISVSGDSEPAPVVSSRTTTVRNAVTFLNDIPEISWWHVDDNTIYIAFNQFYDGWQMTCNAAALKGNTALNFGCHVFGVNARTYPSFSSLGDSWSYNYSATYRHGKKE